jgi:hypothetical protein
MEVTTASLNFYERELARRWRQPRGGQDFLGLTLLLSYRSDGGPALPGMTSLGLHFSIVLLQDSSLSSGPGKHLIPSC